jgi:hypothetical protein
VGDRGGGGLVAIWVVSEVDASVLPVDARGHRVWDVRFANQIGEKFFSPNPLPIDPLQQDFPRFRGGGEALIPDVANHG